MVPTGVLRSRIPCASLVASAMAPPPSPFGRRGYPADLGDATAWVAAKNSCCGRDRDHPAEPLQIAEQPVAALGVLLERHVEEDLIDARVVHLPHVLGDLIPGAVGDGAGGVVEP